MNTGRRLLRGVLAVVALGWAAVGLVLGLMSVLPTPNLGLLWPNLVLDVLAMFVEGYSLLLAAFAVLGIALAALARRAGLRRISVVAAVLGVVTVVVSLVPVVQGWRTASQEGVALSLSEYLSFPSVGSPETVTYARPEGEELQLDVRRPPDQGDTAGPARRPAVVTVHGGGGMLGGRGEDVLWSEWLAEQGYVVFSIDYRLGLPPRWQDATGDVKCAVGWVKENAGRYGVDPDRIALMGRSAGGFFALLAAYTEGDPRLPPSCGVRDTGVEAVAAFYAPTDFTGLDETPVPWWRPNLGSSVRDSSRRGPRLRGGRRPPPGLSDVPRRPRGSADVPGPRRPGPVVAAGAVRAAGGPAGGSRRPPPSHRTALGQAQLRRRLGQLGRADRPPRARGVPGAATSGRSVVSSGGRVAQRRGRPQGDHGDTSGV